MNVQLTFLIIAFSLLFSQTSAKGLNNYYIDQNLPDHQALSGVAVSHDEFYLLCHGKPGKLQINGEWLDKEAALEFISAHLNETTPKAINIFACEYGKGDKGAHAVAFLSKNLGIPVFASNNVTGIDGDWTLEVGGAIKKFENISYLYNLQCIGGTGPYDDCDGDGIDNVFDLDDDNDGITDTDEGLVTNPTVVNIYNPTVTIDNITFCCGESSFGSNNLDWIIIDASYTYPGGSGTIQITATTTNTSSGSVRIQEADVNADGNGIYVESNGNSSPEYDLVMDYTVTPTTGSLPLYIYTRGTAGNGGNAHGNNYTSKFEDYSVTWTGAGTGTFHNPDPDAYDDAGLTTPVGDGSTYISGTTFHQDVIPDNRDVDWFVEIGNATSFTFRANQGRSREGFSFGSEVRDISYSFTTRDTDSDGIPDHFDHDSDNDGCTDADEAYNDATADDDDGPMYGAENPTIGGGGVNNQGLVVSAGIDGSTQAYTTSPNGQYINAGSCTLPVELLYFSGKNAGSANVLFWATSEEINNSHFVLEKSIDGVSFTPLSTINGAGNSANQVNYTYTDNQVTSVITYYRLKQVDFDGSFTYSPVISISNKMSSVNIISDAHTGNISILSSLENYQVSITNLLGQVVLTSSNLSGDQTLSLSNNSGVYIVNVISGEERFVSKVFIK